MKQRDQKNDNATQARPFARLAARELTPAEIDAVSGAKPVTTHATGANGDDPADPGTLL